MKYSGAQALFIYGMISYRCSHVSWPIVKRAAVTVRGNPIKSTVYVQNMELFVVLMHEF